MRGKTLKKDSHYAIQRELTTCCLRFSEVFADGLCIFSLLTFTADEQKMPWKMRSQVSVRNNISKKWNPTENDVSKNQSSADSTIRLPNIKREG
ncbi:UNVERIFIED_CONTAM: hypothetical protein NCL1_41842 [Trichonephila clavipes]